MLPIGRGTNALGDYFFVTIDKETYAINAIMKTCYVLTEQYYIHVTKIAENQLSIYFYNKNKTIHPEFCQQAIHEFLDLLHENQMRQIVLNETKNIHEDIVKQAFSPVAVLVQQDPLDDSLHILNSPA